MAKGSQLTQLKAALSTAGLIGDRQDKKRKRVGPVERDRERRAAKLEEIHRRLNPFDLKVTKLKHDVGGRKLKGVTGKPAKSKQAGVDQRRKTLLKEYEERDRAGGIIDRRFGENDPTMSVEERMLERFTRERQRASTGALFNLEDDEDLTHYGQSLSKLDSFDYAGLDFDSDDEENSGQISRDVVRKIHFSGFDDEEAEGPPRKKTKAEVMSEVIAKSKEHKIRRQMDRDEADVVRQRLDDQFASLRDVLQAPDPSPSSSRAVPGGTSDKRTGDVDDMTANLVPPNDNYDQHVRELAYDKRAKPKDRTKTEEELALEGKEELERGERHRQRRMVGLPETDSESEMRGRKRRADDLDDDFDEGLGMYDGLGAGLGETASGLQAEEAGGLEKPSTDGSSEEDTGDIDEASDIEEESSPLVTLHKIVKGKAKNSGAKTGLPFTFPCPESHDEFLEIVGGVEDGDIPTVVQRIRALYHASFLPENKFKLQKFAEILIDHVLYVSSFPTPHFSVIFSLIPHLDILARTYPIPVAEHFNNKLFLMHKNLKRGLSRDSLRKESKTWPGTPELLLLHIIGMIWPTSDLNHAVISPTRILIGAYLGLGRVRSLSDLASGLFLCTLVFQFEKWSKRFVPEAINFLTNTALHLAPHQYEALSSLPGSFPSPDFKSELCGKLKMDAKVNKTLASRMPNLSDLMSSQVDGEQRKTDLLSLAFDLLGKFADLYKGIEGFMELFDPILSVLEHVEMKQLSEGHQNQLSRLIDSVQRLLKFAGQARQPLRLQAHKPIPIPTYVPKFEVTNSNYLRQRDPDHEKNQVAKLRAQYKQEKKGAIRELRKDARFLANVEQKKQIEKDKAYNDRMKRVVGSIESERAEEKKMQREKAKEKRRAGRK